MTLETLTHIVPRPRHPTDPGKGRDWTKVEMALGTPLPVDYKEFVNLYGTGVIRNHIGIYNPFAEFRDLNLLAQVDEILDGWRKLGAKYEEYSYPFYPELDGLLPWGRTDSGNDLFWRTHGEPDEWTVAFSESRGPEIEQFDGSMTEFLVDLFSGKLKSDVLQGDIQAKRKKVPFIPLDRLLNPT